MLTEDKRAEVGRWRQDESGEGRRRAQGCDGANNKAEGQAGLARGRRPDVAVVVDARRCGKQRRHDPQAVQTAQEAWVTKSIRSKMFPRLSV